MKAADSITSPDATFRRFCCTIMLSFQRSYSAFNALMRRSASMALSSNTFASARAASFRAFTSSYSSMSFLSSPLSLSTSSCEMRASSFAFSSLIASSRSSSSIGPTLLMTSAKSQMLIAKSMNVAAAPDFLVSNSTVSSSSLMIFLALTKLSYLTLLLRTSSFPYLLRSSTNLEGLLISFLALGQVSSILPFASETTLESRSTLVNRCIRTKTVCLILSSGDAKFLMKSTSFLSMLSSLTSVSCTLGIATAMSPSIWPFFFSMNSFRFLAPSKVT
mmetsp:Transcript_211/g.168  ORF Transcript_211/g.168 Transcript_211/m.168 type:complete len:276 (-) Transcript_211:627-1454(-)